MKYVIIFILITLSCCTKSHEEKIIIEGNVIGLPDGVLHFQSYLVKLYSTPTKNGNFKLEIPIKPDFEPIYVNLVHIASKDSVKRLFSFSTKAVYKSKKTANSRILIEKDFPKLEGTISDSDIGINVKSSKIIGDVVFGKQNKVMYEDTIPSFVPYSLIHLRRMVKEFPYSYHVFYSFEQVASSIPDEEAIHIMNQFNQEIRKSTSGVRLTRHIRTRSSNKLNSTTTLPDTSGRMIKVLSPSSKMNLIVLWASWCAPCRQEIPELKVLYKKSKLTDKNLNIVSISVDEDLKKWRKAVKIENMPWNQLIVDEKHKKYMQEFFSFDGSIPTSILVDNKGSIIKKFVGYDKKNIELLEREAL